MFEREFEQGVAAVECQFRADVFAVALDGANADAERVRNLAAGALFGDQFQDAPFARRQIVDRGSLLPQRRRTVPPAEKKRGELRADEFLARRDGFDTGDDLFDGAVFEQGSPGRPDPAPY